MDRTTPTMGTFPSSIEAFKNVQDHAKMHGYTRDVLLASRTGRVVKARVG